MITLDALVSGARDKLVADQARVSAAELAAQVADEGLRGRPAGRLEQAMSRGGISVIAEVKGASPLAGTLRASYDPEGIAQDYERCGAAGISVLTEEKHFAGSLDALEQVSGAVGVPVLRKDFIVDSYQVRQAAIAGASAVLLIAEVLEAGELSELAAEANELGLDALVEIHDPRSLDALPGSPALLGVNNRDLGTMQVSWRHALRIAADLPTESICVAESGITDGEQIRQLRAAGYDGVLVGSHLMTQTDPGSALAALIQEASS